MDILKSYRCRIGIGVVVALLIVGFHPSWASPPQEVVVELGDIGFDMAMDSARNQIYVSLPNRNEIAIVSAESYEIIDRVVIGSRPQGIDLSLDRTTLFVALNGAGAVAYLDLDTKAVTEVVVGAELGDARAYDVVEAKPNRVFVSANPGSSGFAYITMIKRDQGNSAVRVASNLIIRSRPTFAVSPDMAFLYVGSGFSPNSLYKLDLSTDEAPIVLEDDHGSVSGTDVLEVSPDGSRIYLGSGQVLRTGSFVQAGLIGSGTVTLSVDGQVAYVANEPNVITSYDANTFLQVDETNSSCAFSDMKKISVPSDEAGWIILGDDLLCVAQGNVANSVLVSPPSGEYFATQNFDLVFGVNSADSYVSGVQTAALDGVDITHFLKRRCRYTGILETGGETLRCPNFGRWLSNRFGLQGRTHVLDVTFELSDGSTVDSSVSWNILGNSEYVIWGNLPFVEDTSR